MSHYQDKGYLSWIPDFSYDAAFLIAFLLLIYWAWTQDDVRKACRWVYNYSPKLMLTILLILGAVLGVSAGAFGYWSLKKQDKNALRNEPNAPAAERANIITTLVIDSIHDGKVEYHLQVQNGELPITITSVTHKTSKVIHAERSPSIPRDLLAGESLAVNGGPALPIGHIFPNENAFLDAEIAYQAEVKGNRKSFVSNFRFYVPQPVKPEVISPFSVSRGEGQPNIDQDSAEVATRFAGPEGTFYAVLPEVQSVDGKPNIVRGHTSDRDFLFDPTTREVIFESKAQSGRVMRVTQRLQASKQKDLRGNTG